MPRFAFLFTDLHCPACGATADIGAIWLPWGLAVAQKPVPGFDYQVGDRIRWRSCIDGTVLPWTFFRDSSVNIGDPAITDLVVVDWMGWRCPQCDATVEGAAVEIVDGRIRSARLFAEAEFGDDEIVFAFRLLPDGSWVPIREPVYGRGTGGCGPIEGIDDIPRAAVAVIIPPASKKWSVVEPLPRALLEVAREWLGEAPLWVATLGGEAPLAPAAMVDFAIRRGGIFLSGHPPVRARAAAVTLSTLVLGGGGADADLDVVTAELRAIVDRLAPDLAYACVSIEPSFASVVTDGALSDEKVTDDRGLYRPRSLVHQVGDEAILDAYHYQVLGPAHAARLGSPLAGAVPIEGGRVGLTLGSVGDWRPGSSSRAEQRALGRGLLAPLLLGQEEMTALLPAPSAEQLREMGYEPA